MIAPLWRGVDRLLVECAARDAQIARRLCSAAIADARRDSPFRIALRKTAGDFERGDAVLKVRIVEGTLLVSVERGVVIDESEDGLFAPPIALIVQDESRIAAAVAKAFAIALPWRRGSHHANSRSRRS